MTKGRAIIRPAQYVLLIVSTLLFSGAGIAGSTYTNFDVPGAINTSGTSINATGQIAGWWSDNVGNHGFIRLVNGNFITFDVPLATSTIPLAINSKGRVAGY